MGRFVLLLLDDSYLLVCLLSSASHLTLRFKVSATAIPGALTGDKDSRIPNYEMEGKSLTAGKWAEQREVTGSGV